MVYGCATIQEKELSLTFRCDQPKEKEGGWIAVKRKKRRDSGSKSSSCELALAMREFTPILIPKHQTKKERRSSESNLRGVESYYNQIVQDNGSDVVAVAAAWNNIDFVRLYDRGQMNLGIFQKMKVTIQQIKNILPAFEFVIDKINLFDINGHVATTFQLAHRRQISSPSLDLLSIVVKERDSQEDDVLRVHIDREKSPENENKQQGDGSESPLLTFATLSINDRTPSSEDLPMEEAVTPNNDIKRVFSTVFENLTTLTEAKIIFIAEKLKILRGESAEKIKILREVVQCSGPLSPITKDEAENILILANTIHVYWCEFLSNNALLGNAREIQLNSVLKSMTEMEDIVPILDWNVPAQVQGGTTV